MEDSMTGEKEDREDAGMSMDSKDYKKQMKQLAKRSGKTERRRSYQIKKTAFGKR